jgi:integrase/recombinase XerD
MARRKAPPGCFWRGATLWGRIQAGGRDVRWSLQTDDPEIARARHRQERDRQIAIAKFGDDRKAFAVVMEAWSEHIARNVAPKTAARYAVSLAQLEADLDGLYLDEIDGALVGEIVDRRLAAKVTNATIRRDLVALSSVLNSLKSANGGPTIPPAII